MPVSLSEEEMTRYRRQLIMPEIGGDGQQKLKQATVMIAGLGGLGSISAFYMAAAGVGHIPAAAGVFLLADFRRFLDEPTWEAEDRLWRRILDGANVNLTPGSACRNPEPGFLRMCFATEPVEA